MFLGLITLRLHKANLCNISNVNYNVSNIVPLMGFQT